MSDINNDKIDLKPYFKLFRKTLKSVENWIYKNIGFMILSFILLLGVFYTLEHFEEKRFETSSIIDKEFISSEQMKSLLNSTQNVVRGGNTPGFFESYGSTLGEDFKIFDFNFKVFISLKDSLIFRKDNISLDQLDDKGSVRIEIVTNSDSDSVGPIFIKYLNSLSYTESLRKSKTDYLDERLNILNKEINQIDTIIDRLLLKDVVNGTVEHQNINASTESAVFNFFMQKDDLIREKVKISNKLQYMRASEIYAIGEFYPPREIDRFKIFDKSVIIKSLLLSVFIVLFFSYVLRRNRKYKAA